MRFVEDDWESPTLGAWGLGWEVWIDGMEVTQFTYFQQVGGFEVDPVPVEIAYGLERLAMFVQGVDSMSTTSCGAAAPTACAFTYGDVYLENERQYSRYNFEVADTDFLCQEFDDREAECLRTPGGGAAAACLRQRAQVLPRLQPARRARRDIRHRAHGLHPTRAHHRQGGVRVVHGARGGHRARRGRRGRRRWCLGVQAQGGEGGRL